MNRRFEVLKYVLSDYLTSSLAWFLFFAFRKKIIEWPYVLNIEMFEGNHKFWLGIFLIPVGWLGLYAAQGLYHNVFRKSRLKEFAQVFISCFLGCLVIFFVFVLDDKTNNDYTSYYKSIFFLFSVQLTLNGFFRYIITTNSVRKIHNRIIGFKTLIIGSNEKAELLYQELENAKKSAGHKIIGFVHVDDNKKNHILSKYTKHLGFYENSAQIISENNVEEVIIALESKDHEAIQNILTHLQESNVKVKIIPDLYNILTGQVKMNSILHAALIEITIGRMASWQLVTKRLLDITISTLFLLFGSAFYLVISLLVKLSSKGPVFFKQERIGLRGKPFQIIKFRTMFVDAEKNGPALSSEKDSRITSIGRFLRKTRIDETPQFWNVLHGDMSIVGPRPERQFFINQIIKKAPQYKYLQKVKPGITSWGQVKYGYAENVNEMIDRLKFDLIYMENRSLLIDFKIMIHTILVVFQGRGK